MTLGPARPLVASASTYMQMRVKRPGVKALHMPLHLVTLGKMPLVVTAGTVCHIWLFGPLLATLGNTNPS